MDRCEIRISIFFKSEGEDKDQQELLDFVRDLAVKSNMATSYKLIKHKGAKNRKRIKEGLR